MWIADIAALVTRQTGLDWARVANSAKAVGAERMLHIGLRLAADLLQAPLPGEVFVAVQADRVAGLLARQTCKWQPAAGYASHGLIERALFRMRMRGGLIAAPAYLLKLTFLPTEEDWGNEAHRKGHWFIEAARRPFRLARKHSRGGKI